MLENKYVAIADWLDGEAREVRLIEQKAYVTLHDEKNEEAYRELMRSKAERLALLADKAVPYLSKLGPAERGPIMGRLERFSQSASTALNIGSVFFMAALLYPDEYEEGQRNDLESFAVEVRHIS